MEEGRGGGLVGRALPGLGLGGAGRGGGRAIGEDVKEGRWHPPGPLDPGRAVSGLPLVKLD